jgi:hypothetical protein
LRQGCVRPCANDTGVLEVLGAAGHRPSRQQWPAPSSTDAKGSAAGSQQRRQGGPNLDPRGSANSQRGGLQQGRHQRRPNAPSTPEACGLQCATEPRHGRRHGGRHHRQRAALTPGTGVAWGGLPAGRVRPFRTRSQGGRGARLAGCVSTHDTKPKSNRREAGGLQRPLRRILAAEYAHPSVSAPSAAAGRSDRYSDTLSTGQEARPQAAEH